MTKKNPTTAKGLLPSEILEMGWVNGTLGVVVTEGVDDERGPEEIELGVYPTGAIDTDNGTGKKVTYRCAVGGIQQAMYTKAIPEDIAPTFYAKMANAICDARHHASNDNGEHIADWSGDHCIIHWNDSTGRTKSEVVSAFEQVEVKLGMWGEEKPVVEETPDDSVDYSDKEPYTLGSTL